MKVGDYIIARLAHLGARRVFGVYGSANADLFDAFHRVKGIEILCTGHEQTAGFAAEGDVKTSGVPFGVALSTSGPGAMNLITAIGNCYYDSVPVVFLAGQVNSKFLRPPGSQVRQRGFQETDIVPMVQPITKFARRVNVSTIVYELDHAARVAISDRPGPTLLDIPIDVQRAEVDADPSGPFYYTPARANYDELHRAAGVYLTALARAERPVILVGGGAQSAAAEVREFAERVGVPVFPTWNAVDLATDDWSLFGGRIGTYGGKGFNKAFQQADLALVLGCRISGRIVGGKAETFLPHAKVFQVDVDTMAEQNEDAPENRMFVRASVSDFLQALRGEGLPTGRRFSAWRETVRAVRDANDPVSLHATPTGGVNPYLFVRELSKLAPANAIVVGDCGGNVVQMYHAFETKWGQRVISNNGNSPMGFSLAGAIGAALANPDRPVICLIGDGGFLLNVQELQTIWNYHERLGNLKVFVIDNACYGITRAFQKTNLEGRYIACGPDRASGYSAPDVAEVARAFGLCAVHVGNPVTMSNRIADALKASEPWIVNVECPGWQTYLPRVSGWDTPIDRMETK